MKTKPERKHREPSKSSLRDIPEIDFTRAKLRKNPYAARIAAEGLQVGRGRPSKTLEVGKTRPRSVLKPKRDKSSSTSSRRLLPLVPSPLYPKRGTSEIPAS